MVNRTVRIPKNLSRLVAVGPGALRLVCYMNSTEKVVGVEKIERTDVNRPYILAKEHLSELPSIGPHHGGEAELITARNPDLIVATYMSSADAEKLEIKTGVPVLVLKYGDLGNKRKTFYRSIEVLGEVLGKKERSLKIREFFENSLKDIRSRVNGTETKKDIYVGGIGQKGSHGIVSTEPGYTPLKLVNGKNSAGGIEMEHTLVSEEKLVDWDPEIILVDGAGKSLVRKDLEKKSLKSMSAVKNNSVYQLLPYNYYTTNLGTVLANSYYLGKHLHPKKFNDIEPEKKANQIYSFLVGEKVYGEMEEIFGGYERMNIK